MASAAPDLAEGLRRAVLLTAVTIQRDEHEQPPGFAVLAPDNTVAMVDAAAERWLAELGEGHAGLPPGVVLAVADRARHITADPTADPAATRFPARARVRTACGHWLLVRASMLGAGDEAQTAVILEPARPHELAPLIADAYGLTDRERAVTGLVAQGLATGAIAAHLHLSAWPVQDHLKTIFEKVSRGPCPGRAEVRHRPRAARWATACVLQAGSRRLPNRASVVPACGRPPAGAIPESWGTRRRPECGTSVAAEQGAQVT